MTQEKTEFDVRLEAALGSVEYRRAKAMATLANTDSKRCWAEFRYWASQISILHRKAVSRVQREMYHPAKGEGGCDQLTATSN